MNEEVAAHLAMRVDELRALGMSEADAWTEARRRFGDPDDFRDYTLRRAARRTRRLALARWSADLGQDARAALRQFKRTPALNAVVVVTLALAIGATTAVFGVVRHLLLAPLPYADANRIVSLEVRGTGEGNFRFDIGPTEYELWSARSRTLEEFAGYSWGEAAVAAAGEETRPGDTVKVAFVTPSLLPMLRVRPMLGRTFTHEDAIGGAAPVAMVSQSMWRERFAGDPSAIGKSIVVQGVARTIIGVVPTGLGAPVPEDRPPMVWLPIKEGSMSFGGFARLRPGVSTTMASRELDALLRSSSDTSSLKGRRAEVRTARDRLEPQQRRSVAILFAETCGLLLIACADVAGLLLVRGWSRRREFAIRQTLGAGRARLARQLLTESLLLAVPSGTLGTLVGWAGLRGAWVALRPQVLEYSGEIHLDASIIAWTALVSLTTVIVFGAGPAFLAWERSIEDALRVGGSGSGTGRAAGRAHIGLVIAQIALSLVFLSAAGVLGRSFIALVRAPVGYEPGGLIAVSVQRTVLPGKKPLPRLAPQQRATAVRAIRESLAATPGITEVAIGTIPMANIEEGPTAVEGASGIRLVDVPIATAAYVSPEYFRVARISLVRGRTFDSASTAGHEVIINETLARHLWPDREALGARLRFDKDEWATVIGVTRDVRMPGSRAPEFYKLQIYRPSSGTSRGGLAFIVRTRVDASLLRPMLARAIESAGVGASLRTIQTAESTLEFVLRGPRYALAIFGAFALLAVMLAAVGLFGIIAFAVARRTREIGIRVALGADPAALARTILGQTGRLFLVGCVLGLIGAIAASRGFAALVYGVSATDPFALTGAIAILGIVALAAAAFPVRRALRVDPTVALRAD